MVVCERNSVDRRTWWLKAHDDDDDDEDDDDEDEDQDEVDNDGGNVVGRD